MLNALAQSGAKVAGIDICATVDPRSGVTPATRKDLEETGRMVDAAGGRWSGFVLDQRDLPALRGAAEQIERESGGIDILFANGGIQGFKPLLEMTDPDWHITIDVNLTGTANAIRAFAPAMVRRGGGRIIVTTSTQGRHGTTVRGRVLGVEVGDHRAYEVSCAGATYDVTGGDSANYTE